MLNVCWRFHWQSRFQLYFPAIKFSLRYQTDVPWFNSILTLCRCIGHLSALWPHFRWQPTVLCLLYFWPNGYKSQVPTFPLLRFDNLLKWLKELTKCFAHKDWVLLKDTTRSRYIRVMCRAGPGGRDASPHWAPGFARQLEALQVLLFKSRSLSFELFVLLDSSTLPLWQRLRSNQKEFQFLLTLVDFLIGKNYYIH